MSDCKTEVRQYLEKVGKKVSEEFLDDYARKVEALGGSNLNKAEFSAAIENLYEENITKRSIVQKWENYKSALVEFNAINNIDQIEGKRTTFNNLKDWLSGGGVTFGHAVNRDVHDLYQGFAGDLQKSWRTLSHGFEKIFDDKRFDKMIYEGLNAIDHNLPMPSHLPDEVKQAAKNLRSFTNYLFDKAKLLNPRLEKIEDWILTNSHNATKIAKLGSNPEESKAIFTALYESNYGKKSFPGSSVAQRAEYFSEIFDEIMIGTHGRVNGQGGNVLKKLSRERTLIPNDFESAYKMRAIVGDDSISQTISKMIDRNGRNMALLEKFGPAPKQTFENVLNHYQSTLKGVELNNLNKGEKSLRQIFDTAMGYSDAPASSHAGKIASAIRLTEFLAKTGAATINSWGDLINGISLVKSRTGMSFAQSAYEVTSNYMKLFLDFSGEAKIKAANELSAYMQSSKNHMIGGLGTPGDLSDSLGSFMESLGRLNLLGRHTDAMKLAVGQTLTKSFGELADKSFSKLETNIQRGLIRHGITENAWDNVYSKAAVLHDGVKSITVDSIQNLPSENIVQFLKNSDFVAPGTKISQELIDRTRQSLAMEYSGMISHHADLATLTPGTAQKAFMFGGSTADEVGGIVRRALWQFKSAGLTSFDLLRTVYHSGKGPEGDLSGVAHLMGGLFLMSMVSEYAKEIASGKTLTSPTDPEFLFRNFIGSGIGGLATSLLLSQADHQGMKDYAKNTALNLLGPTLGEGLKGLEVLGKYGYSKVTRDKFNSRLAFDWIIRQTPGQNLVYAKPLINYYVLNGIREHMDSGWLHTMHNRETSVPALGGGHVRHFMFDPSDSPRWLK